MGTLWNLFKKDLKAITAFPRLEILLFIFTFMFLVMCYNSIVYPRTPRPVLQIDFIKTYNFIFSLFLSSFFFIIPPLLMTELISGEYGNGTLLALVTYPVKRLEVLTSKFLVPFLLSSTILVATILSSIVIGFDFNNLPIDPRMLLAYFAGLIFLSFLLCSVAVAVSVLSNRLIIAAVAFLVISLSWGTIVNWLANIMNSTDIQIYAYRETVKQLINLLLSPDGSLALFPKEQILTAVAIQLIISISCLITAFWAFQRKEFK